MIKQSLQLKQNQKLSPRQIQLMKLIQISNLEIENRIQEELEINPALELDDAFDDINTEQHHEEIPHQDNDSNDNDIDDYNVSTEIEIDEEHYKDYESPYDYYFDNNSEDEQEDYSTPIKQEKSFYDLLLEQLDMVDLTNENRHIAEHIIGSIDDDGYLRRSAEDIVDDLAFRENIMVEESQVLEIIKVIQSFEPAGIAAKDLQECLILQLERIRNHNYLIDKCIEIINRSFLEISKKHYNKIIERHKISEDELKNILDIIVKLSPKPGASYDNAASNNAKYIVPDFFVLVEQDKFLVQLNEKGQSNVRVASDFESLLEEFDSKKKKKNTQDREAENFIKQKIDNAKWFIEALNQRKDTLLTTMRAIINKQKAFFLTGDPIDLKPMILKDIADEINMDISTISRVSRSKYVQTEHGVYPLKYFFTDSYTNDEGEDISIINVKNTLKEVIDNENKRTPYSDAKLTEIMNEKGYNVARRTIAKYRDQLSIPVAQLRKEL